ncbi:MAG: WG repeat-containing protein, partial [Bacteroidaceae bacterium]|nr:WG repeat-containing protein [Bacteroidaceae bacterium]
MHEVFISYSSKDKIIADAICHALEENKIPCWIAPRDVQPGIPYAREIIKGIKECKVMVLVFTANSNTSEHVCNEIDKAFNNKKIIVPFLVENIAMDEALEYYLSRKHWLTAYPYYEKHLDELVIAVGKVLGRNIVIENKAKKPEQKNVNLPASSNAGNANLKILTDVDCKVFVDCEEKGVAVAGSLLKMPLPPGEYYMEFVSTANEQDRITEEITIERDTLYKVNLNAVQKKREEERSDNLKLVPYIQNKKVGFIDEETMQIVIPCKYNYAKSFSEGLAGVQLNGKYGFIDKTGREIIPCKYDYADSFSEGLAYVKMNGKYGFVKLNGKYGFIDKTGREVIPCKYEFASS